MRADDKVELSQVEYYQKFLDRTQKRFLNACKTLAQVRKLMGINVQINTADKQINVVQEDRSRQNV
jgi:hypothetical protein